MILVYSSRVIDLYDENDTTTYDLRRIERKRKKMKMSAEEDEKTIEKKRTGIEARRADPPTRRYEPCLDCTMRCYTHNPDMQPTKRAIRQKRDAGHRVFPDTSSSPRLRTLKQN